MCIGIAADHLAPKWFTKNPATTLEDDAAEMRNVIGQALDFAEGLEGETVFDLWKSLYGRQATWGRERGLAPLLTHFGVSLVERALLDAFCRAQGRPFAALLKEDTLGFRPGDLHPEIRDATTADLLPSTAPLPRLIARHTVGLSDPLTENDIVAEARVSDGLPQSLEACIAAYSLRHFKLKAGGDPTRDAARLAETVAVIAANVPSSDWRYSIDGNESYRTLEDFRTFWAAAMAHPTLAETHERHLLFVEQPLHRDIALSPDVAEAFAEWPDHPPIIIDESDAELSSLPTALSLGYTGTSHKNCKGVFKGIGNACLLAHRRRMSPQRPLILSGEDLSNVGPVALLQDLAVQAALGIESVERNGHHYFAGLSMFPEEVQRATQEAHPDLYIPSPGGFPSLALDAGFIRLGTVNAAPFGVGFLPDVTSFAQRVL